MRKPDTLRRLVIDVLIVVVLYTMGLLIMEHHRIMETALAVGSHIPAWHVLCAVGFLALRLLLVFVVPGWVIARLMLLRFHTKEAPAP